MTSAGAEGSQRSPYRQGIPKRRVCFFLIMVAIVIFCLWFIYEALQSASPHAMPSVQQEQGSISAQLDVGNGL